ncbi:MAG: DegV family protein [Clostridia bacterium]|nr:DegV family protein [Clostridia bacterium]
MKYTIITDSCCDLNPQLAVQFEQLTIIPMTYSMNGETSQDTTDPEAIHAYYDRLRNGDTSTTSQISPAEFYDVYSEHVKNGEKLLCVHFSSGLSGTYNSACIAREMVLENHPDAVIELVDTLSASAGEGLMVYDALVNRDAGMDIAENAKQLREHALEYAAWFTVDDLHFLKRGGRCSPSAAFFGSMLSIKPVLHVDNEGKLIARVKVRGRKQALKALAEKFGELGGDTQRMTFISHGDCEQDALMVRDMIVEMYGCDPDKVVISHIGPVIGSHSGPGTVAFFFHGKNRG